MIMYAVPRLPSSWPQARDITRECGPLQIQAVLRAQGKNDVELSRLYTSSLNRSLDWCLPWDPSIVLNREGRPSHTRIWTRETFPDEARRLLLDRGQPIIFLVRNALHGKHGLHWLSLWGFDDGRHFAVYDSQAEGREGGLGNARYHETLLTKAIGWHSTFVTIGE